MSEHTQSPNPEEQDNPEDQSMAVLDLAATLEGFACMYSKDYDDKLEDGFTIERGITDLDGLFKSKVHFEARRYRGNFSPYADIPADVEMTEYTIKSLIRREEISFATLPPEVFEYIDQFEDFNLNDYDDNTEVALEYEQTYTVSTDGELIFENSLSIYLDGDGVSLPDNPQQLMPDEDELLEVPSNIDDAFFESVFSESEMDALFAASREVEQEHRYNHPLYRFYELMEDTAYQSRTQRAQRAESIVKYLFAANFA